MHAQLVDLWNAAFGEAFPMDLRLWRQNLEAQPCELLVETREGRPAGFALARRAPGKGWVEALAVAPEWRRQGLGSALLEQACAWTEAPLVRLGAGPAHFFPGVPAGGEGFFAARGFARDWHATDLVLEADEAAPGALPEAVLPCPPDRVPDLLGFLEREFPDRWLTDTRLRLARGESSTGILIALVDGGVEGFCHVYHPGSVTLGPSVYWRAALGERWGGLGPVGVSRAVRGRGLGHAMVEGAIRHLRSLGCRQIGVDWTGIPEFYERFGFRPWRVYRGMARVARQESGVGRRA